VTDLRAGEEKPVLLMGSYYFVLLITYYLLKPARDSLFLVELGPEQLPLVFMLIAVVVAPITRLHSRVAAQTTLQRLLIGATLGLAGCLVLMWSVLGGRDPWLYYVLYIGVSIYGALVVSQFWLLANHVFNASQARRLFAILNVGAILGAFVGGEVANALVRYSTLQTVDLLLVTAGVLVGTLGFIRAAIRMGEDSDASAEADEPTDTSTRASWRTIRESPLLTIIVLIIGVEMVTVTFVDYEFKTILAQTFPSERELTGFLAMFYGRVSLLALGFQLFVLPRLLMRFGVGSALLLMPLGILAGALSLFLLPMLWGAVLLRGADQGFEHSADKVGRELLFLPIPMEVKQRVKVFIDVFVDRGFRGLAGGLLLALTAGFGWGVNALALVIVGLAVLWVGVAWMARTRYTEAFEEALRQGQMEMTTTWTATTSVEQALTVLRTGIMEADDTTILYALQALAERQDERIVPAVRPVLRYPSPAVRREAIKTLSEQPEAPPLPEVEERLMDDDAGIQHAAFHYQFTHGASGNEALAEFLSQRDEPALRQAAAACVVRFGSDEQQHCLTQSAINDLLDHDEHSLRAALAEVLSQSQNPVAHQALIQLARDDNERVRRVAAQSMGATQHPDFVPTLLRMLADDEAHVAVWDALAGYGPSILDALVEAFESMMTDERVRRRIPRVISAIPDQRAADVLMPRLQCTDPVLRYNVSTALLRLRSQRPHITVAEDVVDDALDREVTVYYQLAQALHRFCASFNPSSQHADMVPADDAPVPSTRFDKLINKRLDRSAQRIFQLLGLRYSEPTMRRAYEAIDSDRDQLRALAVEWLDNVLDPQMRRRLRPIVDPPSMEAVAEAGRRLVGVDVNELDEALALLITGPDAKMQASALGMIPHVTTPELLRLAEKATTDPDPRVRTAAEWVLEHTDRAAATA
jgi:ATP/ADP translocase/HEAT repeat protein